MKTGDREWGASGRGGLTAAVDNIIAQHIPVCRPLVAVSDVSVYKHSRHPLYPCTPPRNVENGERLTGLDSCSRSPGQQVFGQVLPLKATALTYGGKTCGHRTLLPLSAGGTNPHAAVLRSSHQAAKYVIQVPQLPCRPALTSWPLWRAPLRSEKLGTPGVHCPADKVLTRDDKFARLFSHDTRVVFSLQSGEGLTYCTLLLHSSCGLPLAFMKHLADCSSSPSSTPHRHQPRSSLSAGVAWISTKQTRGTPN
ncbi:hypothetical protein C0Q70_14363 [Pomacea canaliculata]|uniref:Uncharacterized protein n=1 Tax=Pomacea canaliculata TaxID=400727 RepID=A0A2T7NZU6_POMCA|nr:hypothetical protein C0Q70_14363 [Pomacea canaliculata]